MLNGSELETLPAAELAYRHVKARILDGELVAGAMTSEGEIAEALRLSRTPVREAFLRLESEGWMRLYPKRGALVVPIAAGEAEAILDARLLLEGHGADAVASARLEARDAIIARLQGLVAAQAAAIADDDLERAIDLDVEFHQSVTAAAGNFLLTGFVRGLRERQRRMTARSTRTLDTANAFAVDHAVLAEMLERGDAGAYRVHLKQHIERAYRVAGLIR